jgi:ATP-dependent Zn protease
MKPNPKLILFGIVALTPTLVLAQDSDGGNKNSTFASIVATLLPIVLIGGFLFFFLRRAQTGPAARRIEQYRVRHEQHMQKMEDTLERIAKALEEKKN